MDVENTIATTQEAIATYRLSFSVDCVIFGYRAEGLKILLVECNLPPYVGKWSLLGDFVRDDEDLESAAHRVLLQYSEEDVYYLEQVKTFGDRNRHPLGRVITTAFYSLISFDSYNVQQEIDGLKLSWFPIDQLPELAFDHDKILMACLMRLRRRLRQRPIGFELLPKEFTLSQLRTLYEVVLDIELDKRNFRRKLRALNLLVETGNAQSEVAHRPAKLYSFDYCEYEKRMSSGVLQFEL